MFPASQHGRQLKKSNSSSLTAFRKFRGLPFGSSFDGEKPLLFTIDAPAIGLSIHAHFLGNLYSVEPTHTKILIVEFDLMLDSQTLSNSFDQRVILKLAIKKGRGETIEPSLLCSINRALQTVIITIATSVFFPECNIPEKLLQIIFFLVCHT
jgi:hypothetical protein